MSDRKAELEKKKARLQAMREEKERRRREKEQKDAEEASLRAAHADKDQRKELDEMLSSLGVAPVSDVLSSLSSVASTGTAEQSNSATPDTSLQVNTTTVFTPGQRKKSPQLSVVSVQTTSIPPKEMVTYTKQTQTTNAPHERDGIMKRTKKEKVDIEAIRCKYENELKSIPDSFIHSIVKCGKKFIAQFKAQERSEIDRYKLCTTDEERMGNIFMNVLGIPVKMKQPFSAGDVSIKRFFALIHGESYSRLLKEIGVETPLKSAIITKVHMPDVCSLDETVALVGTGFEFHTNKFKKKKALLFYYTILLDYLEYTRNRIRNKANFIDINRFLAEGDRFDKTVNISTLKAVTRRIGYGVSELSAAYQKLVITWVKETKFSIYIEEEFGSTLYMQIRNLVYWYSKV